MSTPSTSTATELAKQLFTAVAAGDIATIERLYAPDIIVWHNYDGVGQTAAENLRTLRWLTRNVTNLRYEEIRLEETPGGFVQQYVLRATAPDGSALEVPVCMVGAVEGGRITRLDEYMDSAHVRSLPGPWQTA